MVGVGVGGVGVGGAGVIGDDVCCFYCIFFVFFYYLCYSPNKGGTTGVGFLLTLYRTTFVPQDLPSWYLPRLA